jgi:hypothetical protein
MRIDTSEARLPPEERAYLEDLRKQAVAGGFPYWTFYINKIMSKPVSVMTPCREVHNFPLNTDPALILMLMRGYASGYRAGSKAATHSAQAALRELCGISENSDDNTLYVNPL